MKKNYLFFITILFFCLGCNSVEKIISNLESKQKEVHKISSTNKRDIVIYFSSGFKEIISKLDLPYVEEKVILYYKILIDVKTKAIVNFDIQEITKDVQTMELGSKIGIALFKNLDINTRNMTITNPYHKNIRGERSMAYIGVRVCLTKDTFFVGNVPCFPDKETESGIPPQE